MDRKFSMLRWVGLLCVASLVSAASLAPKKERMFRSHSMDDKLLRSSESLTLEFRRFGTPEKVRSEFREVSEVVLEEIVHMMEDNTDGLQNKFSRELFFKGSDSFIRFIAGLLPDVQTDRTILRKILDLLARQTDDNPVFYASHGTDHGLRTMDICLTLKETLGLEVDSDELGLMCLLHDVGYSALAAASDPAPHKSLHAYAGMRMVEDAGLLKSTQALEAIGYHNYDTAKASEYPLPDLNEFSGDLGDWQGKKGHIRRFNKPASFDVTPYLSLLRIADNLEVSAQRLAIFQNHRYTMRVLLYLWETAVREGFAEKAVNHFSESNLPAAFEFADQLADLDPSTRKESNPISPVAIQDTFLRVIVTAIPTILHNQFPHWYSNYIVQSAQLTSVARKKIAFSEESEDAQEPTQSQFDLTITFRTDVPDDLAWYNHVPWCMYQITRAAESFRTISVTEGGETLDQLVWVKIRNCESGAHQDACQHLLDHSKPHTLDYFASESFLTLTPKENSILDKIAAVSAQAEDSNKSEDTSDPDDGTDARDRRDSKEIRVTPPSPKGLKRTEDVWSELIPGHEDLEAFRRRSSSLEEQPSHRSPKGKFFRGHRRQKARRIQ